MPDAQIAHGLLQHHLRDVGDQAQLLRQRHKALRRQCSQGGVMPAHQGLEAGKFLILKPHDRLIGHIDLPAFHRPPQIMLQLHGGDALAQHAPLEQGDAAAPVCARGKQGDLRPFQRIFRPRHLTSEQGGHADARR